MNSVAHLTKNTSNIIGHVDPSQYRKIGFKISQPYDSMLDRLFSKLLASIFRPILFQTANVIICCWLSSCTFKFCMLA